METYYRQVKTAEKCGNCNGSGWFDKMDPWWNCGTREPCGCTNGFRFTITYEPVVPTGNSQAKLEIIEAVVKDVLFEMKKTPLYKHNPFYREMFDNLEAANKIVW